MDWLAAHPIIHLPGGLSLATHGVLFAIGAEISLLFLAKITKKDGVPSRDTAIDVAYMFIGGLIAARIGFFLVYPSQYKSFADVFAIWQGGLLSYSGMAVGLAIGWYRHRELSAIQKGLLLDRLVVAGSLGWAIGRIGNYYAADSIGVLSTFWSAFYGRVPIQLFESLLCFGLAGFGWWYMGHNPKRKPGILAGIALIAYFLGRAFIDIWRDEGFIGPLHLSQAVSLVIAGLLIGLYAKRWKSA